MVAVTVRHGSPVHLKIMQGIARHPWVDRETRQSFSKAEIGVTGGGVSDRARVQGVLDAEFEPGRFVLHERKDFMIAAASIAGVYHVDNISDGSVGSKRQICTKVLRGGVDEAMRTDRRMIGVALGHVLSTSPEASTMSYDDLGDGGGRDDRVLVESLVTDILDGVDSEQDLWAEGHVMRNMRTAHEGGMFGIRIPRVVAISKRAIVMEYLRSQSVGQWVRSGDATANEKRDVARRLFAWWSSTLLMPPSSTNGSTFVHGDLHPSNVGVEGVDGGGAKRALVVYDFGNVLRVDERTRRDLNLALALLVMMRDIKGALHILDTRLGVRVDPKHSAYFEAMIKRILEDGDVYEAMKPAAGADVRSPPVRVGREAFRIMRAFLAMYDTCCVLDPGRGFVSDWKRDIQSFVMPMNLNMNRLL